jgi:hypothetical protein
MESRDPAAMITSLLRQLIAVHDPSVVGVSKRKVLSGDVTPSSVSKDMLPKMYPYCLGILSSHLQPSRAHNATHLSELVKRKCGSHSIDEQLHPLVFPTPPQISPSQVRSHLFFSK